MKYYILLVAFGCLIFGYNDCCEAISDNFDPKEIKGEYKNPNESFDYRVFGDGFVNFSSSKVEYYSNSVITPPKESETLVEFVESERTGDW